MGTGYTRQSAATIVDGEVINAGPLNAEFNGIRDAFDATSGHSHDGTLGEGPKLSLLSSVTGVLPVANGGTGGLLPVANGGTGGLLPLENGGTGVTTAAGIRTVLGLHAVATSGSYNDLINKPTLGTAAATDTTAYATAAQGTKADNALPAASKALGADVLAGTDNTKYVTADAITDAMPFYTISPGAMNMATFINGGVTLTGPVTFTAPTNPKDGASGTLAIKQDATGGRTASWNVFWDFGPDGPPTLSTGANVTDYVFYQIKPGAVGAICSFKAGA